MADPVEDALATLKNKLPKLESSIDDPQSFILDIHRLWKSAGGFLAGKPRHSDRFLLEQLTAKAAPVKSLTPKLMGTTRLKASDGDTLLRFFLANWPEPSRGGRSSPSQPVSYGPLLTFREIDDIAALIAERFTSRAKTLPSRTATRPTTSPIQPPRQDSRRLITTLFQQCDALITIGTQRPLLTAGPRRELIGFRDLMNTFWAIEQADNKKRMLIWILELGRQTFEEYKSRQRYIDVQQLITRLKALRLFEDEGRDARLKWLVESSAFVVLDTRSPEPIDLKGLQRPNFIAHHVSFSALPPLWVSLPEFRSLFGPGLDYTGQRNFSAFVKTAGWNKETTDERLGAKNHRYIGYTAVAPEDYAGDPYVGAELPSPGASYEDAMRSVYAAAGQMLKNEKGDAYGVKYRNAGAQLKYLSFRILSLNDFIDI